MSTWRREVLKATRQPLLCDGCRNVIEVGASVYCEERARARFACSVECGTRLSARVGEAPRPAGPPASERPRFGDGSQGDDDKPF